MVAAFSSLRRVKGQAACFQYAVAKREHKRWALIVNLHHHMTALFLLLPDHHLLPSFLLTSSAPQCDSRVQSTPVSPLKHQCQAVLDEEGVLLQRYGDKQGQWKAKGKNKFLLSIPCYHHFCVVFCTSFLPSDFYAVVACYLVGSEF